MKKALTSVLEKNMSGYTNYLFFCTLTILAVPHFALDDKMAHMVHALGVRHLFLSNRHNRKTPVASIYSKGLVINTGKL